MINWLEASGLERDHCGTPESLHWLLIRPNGTMTVCRSDNRIWSLAIPTERYGVVVVARHDRHRPDNPIATAMLWAVGIDYWVRGSAAWLGEREPACGFHRDLNESQIRELRTVAAHCRT